MQHMGCVVCNRTTYETTSVLGKAKPVPLCTVRQRNTHPTIYDACVLIAEFVYGKYLCSEHFGVPWWVVVAPTTRSTTAHI